MQIYLRFPEAQPNFKLRSRLILVQAELLDKKGKVLETVSTIVGREKSKLTCIFPRPNKNLV